MTRHLLLAFALIACSAPAVPPRAVVSASAAETPGPSVRAALATPRPTTFATPAARPSSSPGADWKRYVSPDGPVVSLPAAWVVIEPDLYDASVSFAAAPSGADVPIDRQAVTAIVHVIRAARPLAGPAELADLVQSAVPGLDRAERTEGVHPSGPVVVLKYTLEIGALPVLQEADALFVRDGAGIILGVRAPAERMGEYADVLEEIFQRFRL